MPMSPADMANSVLLLEVEVRRKIVVISVVDIHRLRKSCVILIWMTQKTKSVNGLDWLSMAGGLHCSREPRTGHQGPSEQGP